MNEQVPRIRIPLFEEQLGYVTEAVRSGYLARGPHLEMLAERLRGLFDKRYVVLTGNGFSALFASLKAARPEPTRIVTTPASTCFAMVNAIRAAGHEPCFIDMDPSSASLTNVCDAEGSGVTVDAIVPDHFGIIAPACRGPKSRSGLLIEDAAQAFLSRSLVPTAADVVVLSFYPTKIANGIDGGAILTDDADLCRTVQTLVSYVDQTEHSSAIRYNLGMNNLNAAFALGTLVHLEEIAATLRGLHRRLADALVERGIRFLVPAPREVPSRLIVLAETETQRDSMMSRLRSAGIEVSLELMRLCEEETAARFPSMLRLLATTFSLPFHPAMSDTEVATIEKSIRHL